MSADGKFLTTTTTKSYFDFSDKGGRLKQFVYGNTLSVLVSFWVSVSKFFFFLVGLMGLSRSLARVRSDKDKSLAVSGEQHPSFSSGYKEQDRDGSGFNIKERNCHDNGDHVEREVEISDSPVSFPVSISKRYEFLSDNSISGFVEEPKALSFVVHDLYLGSDKAEEEPAVQEGSIDSCIVETMLEKSDNSSENCIVIENKENSDDFVTEHVKEEMVVHEFMGCDDVREESIHDNCVRGERVWIITEESFSDDDDFIELRPQVVISGFVDEEEEEFIEREDFSMSFEEHGEVYTLVDDDYDYEQDDLLERLKRELRNARAGGLATILEESETPLEEPGPLKIDEKFELKDRIAEIQKVHKSYTVRMRKLDVLDSQTMHSISLIKLKESTKPCVRNGDSSVRACKLPLRKNLWPFKKQQLERSPVERLVKETGRDFETVYVGHLCLSWEILHWQYVNVLEFQQHDPTGFFQYNVVAGEFQLFQVLVQRFMEGEPFQSGPRIDNYLMYRRRCHSFLQVPLLRDDRSSSKATRCGNEGEFAITIETLREMVQKSMRVFSEFICADRHVFSSNSKVSHQTQVSPQDTLDPELLSEIRTNLQKKEKRLKEVLRSRACIVKKLKKNEAESVDLKDELMMAQIELRLVSRVTNMSKLTTDQLVWCREKLDKINFHDRRIHLEHSLSLFPC